MRYQTRSPYLVAILAGIVTLWGCADQISAPHPPGEGGRSLTPSGPSLFQGAADATSYLLLGAGEALPEDLEAMVAAAGGTLTQTFPEIGVAVVTADDAAFVTRAEEINGVESVVPNLVLQWVPELKTVPLEVEASAEAMEPAAAFNPSNESFWGLQWAPGAIQAPEAWAAGYTGKGVRVAVIDGGIWDQHVDIAPNLDRAASASAVPGSPYNTDTGTFWHGTHVAGIIAAAANGIGTIGIAPEATIIGVKALHSGSGAFSWVINAILYAATPIANGGAGADVINMSLGAVFDGKGDFLKGTDKRDYKKDVNELLKAIDRAVWYANRMGVTVIAAAGNEGLDFEFYKEAVSTPAGNRGVLSIAATAPTGWAKGATNFDQPTSYTNFGKGLVSFSAPGGGYDYPENDLCLVQAKTQSVLNYCYVFDYVLSASRGSGTTTTNYSWAVGTSMASPMAAGVAALIIQKNGGPMHPAQVEARLLQSSIGNGNNNFHGHGWVNAWRAVQ
jgi:subtilisin family serine protease